MKTTQIARLKITLARVKPAVFRRIEVPLAIRLDRLHLAIQAAMGWTNSHLYEFRSGDMGWGEPHPDYGMDGPVDAGKARLGDVLGEIGAKTLDYIYDFGDGWDHKIKIERIESAMPGIAYPRLLAAAGACPPEDVGGSWGYAKFTAAINDPKHEHHAHYRGWYDADFDPAVVDLSGTAARLAALAELWSQKRPNKRKD